MELLKNTSNLTLDNIMKIENLTLKEAKAYAKKHGLTLLEHKTEFCLVNGELKKKNIAIFDIR